MEYATQEKTATTVHQTVLQRLMATQTHSTAAMAIEISIVFVPQVLLSVRVLISLKIQPVIIVVMVARASGIMGNKCATLGKKI